MERELAPSPADRRELPSRRLRGAERASSASARASRPARAPRGTGNWRRRARRTRAAAARARRGRRARISGVSASSRPRWSSALQSRMQRPGATRPARPRRCSAEAFETRPSSSRSSPLAGSKLQPSHEPAVDDAVTPAA
jgi:hypothetical protein